MLKIKDFVSEKLKQTKITGIIYWFFCSLVAGGPQTGGWEPVLPSSSLCSSAAGLNITAGPGENVTLTCKAEDTYSVVVLEWKRDNLGKKKVFVVKDGRPFLSPQHESFKNRVFLLDPQMKNGDLSVVLKNVKIEDSGIYMCRVLEENDPFGSPLKMISSINLSVYRSCRLISPLVDYC
uniref:Ig-like domain-containing protein n=1 Tax=Oryzias melastigma TaxID=30732 RepID=A0A3B3DUX8_ORYME